MQILKPPMLTGDNSRDNIALRDWMFQLARSLETVTNGESTVIGTAGGAVAGSGGGVTKDTEEEIRRNARELRDLIIKSANDIRIEYQAGDTTIINELGMKEEEYNSLYVAKSEFGDFAETINTVIQTTARGVVESYDYGSAIQSLQGNIDLVQNYFTRINGEIRRGIILDPDTGDYVTGIAISQALSFSGECGPSDSNNPGDGYTYYYLTSGQTFGLYTSVGWQFWIDGHKKGWFNSQDGMLHVANVYVEQSLRLGDQWQFAFGPRWGELNYIGG